MAKVAIIGAAGRMGRLLVSNVLEHPGMSLAGALEHPACPFVGKDAAEVAGYPAAGVLITASLEEALKDAMDNEAIEITKDALLLSVRRRCPLMRFRRSMTLLTTEPESFLPPITASA